MDLISYQAFSRNNSTNGIPYRLIIIYKNCISVAALEVRESMYSQRLHEMLKEIFDTDTFIGMPTFHLAVSEYNSAKKCYKTLDKFVDGEQPFDQVVEEIKTLNKK